MNILCARACVRVLARPHACVTVGGDCRDSCVHTQTQDLLNLAGPVHF